MDGSIEAWLAAIPAHADEVIHHTGLPLVTLSYAQSLDGCITARRGQPLALSGPPSLSLTHRLRAVHGAVLVGIGTVLADDPQLTVRLARGANPRPVVLDSRLRFPAAARLLARSENLPWIFCAPDAPADRSQELARRGARLLPTACDDQGRLNLRAVLSRLAQEGIASLMVEGGARVISHFLADGLVDQVMITTAPIWVGGLHVFDAEWTGLVRLPVLVEPRYSRFGRDLVTWGEVGLSEVGRGE